MQNEQQNSQPVPSELSEVWRELLGEQQPGESAPLPAPDAASLPTLAGDPWSKLLHENGIEIVDLQKIHLHMSDKDVEQILRLMQEQSDRGKTTPSE